MAFHVDMNVKITSYARALSEWENTRPWARSTDTNVRPLDRRKKKHMTIRKLEDGSIALSLYKADVVVYHPDDKITFNPYKSISTDKFAHALTPNGLCAHFNDGLGYLMRLQVEGPSDERPYGKYIFYKFSGPFTVKPIGDDIWAVDESTTTQVPFQKYIIDRKKAKQASNKYNLSGFTAWFNAVRAMDGFKDNAKKNFFWNDKEMTELLLSDREDKWVEFVNHVWLFEAVKKFRDLIYRVEKVGAVTQQMTLDNWDEWRAFSQSVSRNRFYVDHV